MRDRPIESCALGLFCILSFGSAASCGDETVYVQVNISAIPPGTAQLITHPSVGGVSYGQEVFQVPAGSDSMNLGFKLPAGTLGKFEIKVDLPAGAMDARFGARALAAFRAAYAKSYGYQDDTATVEAVDWYLVARVERPAAASARAVLASAASTTSRARRRRAWFPEAGGFIDCRVVARPALRTGDSLRGPAIVEESETSTVLLPGDIARVSRRGNLVVTCGGT